MTQESSSRSVPRDGGDQCCSKAAVVTGVCDESRDVLTSQLDGIPETDDQQSPKAQWRRPCGEALAVLIPALIAVICMRVRVPITRERPQPFWANGRTWRQEQLTRSTVSSLPHTRGIAVTIYSYDRPMDLARLLQDIERESLGVQIPVRVYVVDDNALGCAPLIPVANNIFDEFDPRNASAAPISQIVPASPNENQTEWSNTSGAVHCSSKRRYRVAEAVISRNTDRGWKLFSAHYRHGRRRYWHLVRMTHGLLREHAVELNADYFLFLPDDVRLGKDFFTRAVSAWNSVNDPNKLTLMLHIEESRLDVAVWTDILPERVSEDLHRIGWVESGNFIADERFMHFVNWSFPWISPKRWRDNPPISSGVGALLSETIRNAGFSMYRTDRSLLAHVGVTLSKMNSAFREKGSAAHMTMNFVDGEEKYRELLLEASTVTASIASVWNREISLHSSVDSLAHQVDHVNVYLNGYDTIPWFLQVPHVTAVLSSRSPRGDMGDVGKFYWANDLKTDYHVTADDDMIYPDDYVAKHLHFLTLIQGPAVVGVHGVRIVHERLIPKDGRRGNGYYGSREVWMGTGHASTLEGVHILGTGALMYRVSDFGPVDLDACFRRPNMADIWFGILGQHMSIPFVVIPHAEGWLREFPGTSQQSLYREFTKRRNADRHQTAAAISAAPWKVYPFQLTSSRASNISKSKATEDRTTNSKEGY